MIRLSQLFKRDSQPDDGLRASLTRSRSDSKFSSRGSRVTADDPVLTEDPEYQRARHRLIGAAVLVLIAIVVLPPLAGAIKRVTWLCQSRFGYSQYPSLNFSINPSEMSYLSHIPRAGLGAGSR